LQSPEDDWLSQLFILGLNLTGWNGVMMTMVTEVVPSRHTGLSSGISYSIGNIGTMTGVPITGLIIEKFGYAAAFSFLSIIVFIALLLISYVTYKKYREGEKGEYFSSGLSEGWLQCNEGERTWNATEIIEHLIEAEKINQNH
jgi:MFS family permease